MISNLQGLELILNSCYLITMMPTIVTNRRGIVNVLKNWLGGSIFNSNERL
jgi:hypothetical protein